MGVNIFWSCLDIDLFFSFFLFDIANRRRFFFLLFFGELEPFVLAVLELKMSSDPPHILSFHDLTQHSNDRDCWIAVHSKIYDITDYLDSHPGGSSSLFSSSKPEQKGSLLLSQQSS